MTKKYRVRLVVDDVLAADSPQEAKEGLWDLFVDGFYGSKAYRLKYYFKARRRKDLEQAESQHSTEK